MSGGAIGPDMRDAEHFTPETLDEAAALLLAMDSPAPPVARGTDLVAEGHEGQRTLSMVLDLQRIPELNRLEYDERNGLRIGAAVPFATLLDFSPVRRLYPMLADGCTEVLPSESLNRTTLGGSLGYAGPSAELASPLICLRASAAVFGPHGWSELAVEAMFPAVGRRVLQPGEFLVDLHCPAPAPRSNGAFVRGRLRGRVASTEAGVAVFLVLEQDLLTCCGARLTLCGVTPTPFRALEAERFLSGRRLEDAVAREAAALAAGSVGSMARSSLENLEPLRELTLRAIAEALARVRAVPTA